MSYTQNHKIVDAFIGGLGAAEIAHSLGLSLAEVQTVLENTANEPSNFKSASAGVWTTIEASGTSTLAAVTCTTLAASGHVGFNGQSAVGKSSAYTKTYSTETRTIPAATYVAPTATAVEISSGHWGYTTEAGAKSGNEQLIALAADVLALKKLIVSIIVDLQAVGIAG